MAKNNSAEAKTSAGAQMGIKPWVLFIPVLLIALVFLPSSAVITAGMIPTLVARLVDTSAGRRLSITVGALNLVGCLYFLHRIWSMGHSVNDIPTVLGDTFGWLSALLGAGAGWVIFGFMPALIAKIAETQTTIRLNRVTQDQGQLIEEWGEAVRGIHGVKVLENKPKGEAGS